MWRAVESAVRGRGCSLHEAQPHQGKMSRDICIHAWPCSYYLDLEKRWVPGKLSLTSLSLKFTADRAGEVLVGFPLSSITEVKKEASHFIFSSITILEKDHGKHWFSSLRPSRNVVFTIIEHFWRELLLSQPGAAMNTVLSPSSRGKELTGLMARSQKRLEDTAKVLHHQGEQLGSVMRGLEKMESDLDVADRLLTELESPSWWPFSPKLWKMPSESKPREDASVASFEPFGKEGLLITIPAIISETTGSQAKPGRLTILISGLEIHDSNSLLLHRFAREDIDDIKVHSPYEISIRQRFIGKPDVAYRVISAKMPKAIPILEVQFSKKIELLEDTSELRSTGVSFPTEKSCSVWHTAAGLLGRAGRHEPAAGGQEGTPLELQRSAPFLSEEEAEELSEEPNIPLALCLVSVHFSLSWHCSAEYNILKTW
ncbi:synaptosomal-associated protein 47 isoform X2 [Oryctolagus cuniculus]|uniref:synaptosomal-associated protein 47 isoform X2 n=1 Tax=Oryctolagus cuniculus TaxID=9986 RepID=UPI00222E6709|nr:synaptosomal-associated protein 47 isoform X3 [Oryctolagus cuniculus]